MTGVLVEQPRPNRSVKKNNLLYQLKVLIKNQMCYKKKKVNKAKIVTYFSKLDILAD